MGDLIDRDTLGVGPANPEVFKNTAYADGWNALLRIINQAPAVDAAPVVHTPCGMDEKDIPSLAYWLKDKDLVSEYGKFWRCWPRKPTKEQMAAVEWEE